MKHIHSNVLPVAAGSVSSAALPSTPRSKGQQKVPPTITLAHKFWDASTSTSRMLSICRRVDSIHSNRAKGNTKNKNICFLYFTHYFTHFTTHVPYPILAWTERMRQLVGGKEKIGYGGKREKDMKST